MIRLCDWEEIGDEGDMRLNQQGDMIALRTENGVTYNVYFNHEHDKAFLSFPEETTDEIREIVFKIINALGYEPVAV